MGTSDQRRMRPVTAGSGHQFNETPVNRRAVLTLGASGIALLSAGCSNAGSGVGSFFDSSLGMASTGSTASLGTAPLRVAVLLPMSRDPQTAVVAGDLKQAAELALNEQNRQQLTILHKDTFGTPEGAAAAAREAIAEGVELIIGPLFASEVAVVRAVAKPAKVPIVAFSTDRAAGGDGAWLLSFLAGADVDRVVSYGIEREIRHYAGLVPMTPYGDAIASAFLASVAAKGGKVVGMERFPPDAGGMVGPVLSLKSALKAAATARQPVQALLIAGGQESLPTLAPMLTYHGIDLKSLRLIGTGAWNVPTISRVPALTGGWFAAPDPTGWQAFSNRFQQAHGRPPVRIAGLAYDAVSLAVSLSSGAPGQRFTPELLTRSSGFAGVDGLFRLNADGTCERGLAVLEVQPLGPRLIEPAPAAFGPVGF